MKIKLLFCLLVMGLSFSTTYASFPVTRAAVSTTTSTSSTAVEAELTSPAVAVQGKKMSTALLLWFFLGLFAAHRWYLGSPVGWNILYIITLGGLGIWAIIDLIDIIMENYPGL